MLAFYSDDPSSNSAELFVCKYCLKRTKNCPGTGIQNSRQLITLEITESMFCKKVFTTLKFMKGVENLVVSMNLLAAR